MSKELEAIQVLKANAILFDDGSDYGASMLEAIEVLDNYLTPPNEQEVCEALSEYYQLEIVFFENKLCSSFEIKDKKGTDAFIVFYDKRVYFHGGPILTFWCDLPPHLVEMIGKFYKGKVKENERNSKI